MISGFNTDIEYEGKTYHIQTEDKGLDTPMILSLVYTGGEILASKRSSYEDLVATGFDEAALIDRLHRQHKLICAAILAGRMDDLKRMTERDAVSRVSPKARSKAHDKTVHEVIEFQTVHETQPTFDSLPTISVPVTNIVKEVVHNFSLGETGGDDELTIGLIDEVPLRGGDRVLLKVLVSRGNDENNGINGAEVLVKVLGSTFRPLMFQARTGSNGIATIRMQLPHFTTGRAAVLVRTTVSDGDAELRRIINQG